MAKLHVGASLVRSILSDAAPEDAAAFARLLWPELSKAQCDLIARFTSETRCNGAYLIIPASWGPVRGAPANDVPKPRGRRARVVVVDDLEKEPRS